MGGWVATARIMAKSLNSEGSRYVPQRLRVTELEHTTCPGGRAGPSLALQI